MAAAATVWLTLGMFVAIVAGVGLFMDDLKPSLHTFWRSRPIPLGQWFGVKVTIGLASMLVILAVPTLAIASMLWSNLADAPARRQEILQMAILAPIVQACLFTVAAAAITLVRQPIYAAVLTIGVMLASVAAFEFVAFQWQLAANELKVVGVACLSLFAASLGLAWCAIRRDWGLKG
jgi:ABC-type transport system involved in multi-copper enzyme maturation permease subunit